MSDHTEPMPTAEVLAKAAAFDPTQVNREAVMRLALEMILKQAHQRGIGIEPTSEQRRAYFALSAYGKGVAEGLDRARRIAEQALRECGS